jgi:hypothetical protein
MESPHVHSSCFNVCARVAFVLSIWHNMLRRDNVVIVNGLSLCHRGGSDDSFSVVELFSVRE